MAQELFPILETTDLERSLRFYRDLLGGAVSYQFPGSDGATVYAGVDIGRSHVGIGLTESPDAPPARVVIWIYVEDCDAMVAQLRNAGVPVLEEPIDQPWGERVALVADPDGIRVRIANRAAADAG